jgi:hypothetical protein
MEVWDSPELGGHGDRRGALVQGGAGPGLGGMLEGPAAHFMTSPPVRHSDERARQMREELIAAAVPPVPLGDEATHSARGDDAGVGASTDPRCCLPIRSPAARRQVLAQNQGTKVRLACTLSDRSQHGVPSPRSRRPVAHHTNPPETGVRGAAP